LVPGNIKTKEDKNMTPQEKEAMPTTQKATPVYNYDDDYDDYDY
jgi:hypothetical protein